MYYNTLESRVGRKSCKIIFGEKKKMKCLVALQNERNKLSKTSNKILINSFKKFTIFHLTSAASKSK